MSYENLRSTKLLATHCAVCGRILRDAKSAEMGIGPDCAQKYGYNSTVNDANRVMANQLIFLIADKQNGLDAVDGCRRLRNLGFVKLASKIAIRLMSIKVMADEQNPKLLNVTTPYTQNGIDAMRSIPGRRWDSENYVNVIPVEQKAALWKALLTAFPGYDMLGPDGNFYKIERKSDAQKKVATAA